MSRPRSSVPNQNSVLGGLGSPSGVRPVVRYCVSTPCPVSDAKTGAKIATQTISTMTTNDTMATRSRRSRSHASRQGLRPWIDDRGGSAGPARERVGRRRSSPPTVHGVVAPLGPRRRESRGRSAASRSPGSTGKWQAARWPSPSSSCAGEQRLLADAPVPRLRAARMEPTTRGRIDRRRDVAAKDDPLAAVGQVGIGYGHGREQRRRVRVTWPLVQLVGGGDLDDLAEVHHRDPVAHVRDDGQVVGDEDVGERELALQVGQQVDDLRLDRDVQGRHRLVADDQLRAAGRARGRRRCAAAGRRRTRRGTGCSARG